ncbi:plastocyanin/azurin family copper-binding protein [Rhodohalobacter sp. 8-1]|uniref:plastocyanin/azurin family copper-binding protein n=1 Tax=Rhodohalobacter sp. 8-1 TaxID=3131972 RepID=UPI0030ECFFC4
MNRMLNLSLKQLFATSFVSSMLLLICANPAIAQQSASAGERANQNDYYQITTLPAPDDVVLEVGGLALLPNGKLAAATRRGEIWVISNPEMINGRVPTYTKFAEGMYENLGLEYKDGSLYTSQRGELTKLTDTNGDDITDLYERVYAWPVSGHYHEYSYGPAFLPNGDMVVTGNVAFGNPKWWEAQSHAPWRGWMMIITPDGEMRPFATGMRSPSGVMVNDEGDIFYSENQGDWIGSGFITHVEEGDFTGNPAGLKWADHPMSPVDIDTSMIVDSEQPMYETAKKVPAMKLPAVWVPHTLMGTSTTGMIQDTAGVISPFKDHYYVADQGHARVNRATMEKVDGEYQGAIFPFIYGLDSGALRMALDKSRGQTMYVGLTDRGWSSTGEKNYGLQRVDWTGKIPFEMKTITATPDGFNIEFTHPVDKEIAADPSLYNVTSFTYMYRYEYGSPIINREDAPVKGLQISDDGKTVRLVVDNLRKYYIHEVKIGELESASGTQLLHDVGYYTLNNIPSGVSLSQSDWTATAPSGSPSVESSIETPDSPGAYPSVLDEQGDEAAAPATKRVVVMPDSWEDGADQTIELGTVPGLKYSKDKIEVKAGSRVRFIFNNSDDMLHNMVIVKPETADPVGRQAMNLGLQGEDMEYIPETDDVLYHTNVVLPGRSETIYFTVPDEPGTYQYVCTFPGHYISMRGTLVVTG